jgi:large subunit ribosomal protein L5
VPEIENMHRLEYYYINVIKPDLNNKFLYESIGKIPKIDKITLSFGCKTQDLKKLSISFLSMQLICDRKGSLTLSSQSCLSFKIRKGNPVGCKIVLRKAFMYGLLSKMQKNGFPLRKNGVVVKPFQDVSSVSFNYSNVLVFDELEKNYFLFNTLKDFQITITTTARSTAETLYILNAFKFPIA